MGLGFSMGVGSGGKFWKGMDGWMDGEGGKREVRLQDILLLDAVSSGRHFWAISTFI